MNDAGLAAAARRLVGYLRSQRAAMLLLASGVALGVGVWVFSPWLTGHVEPWDAERPIWIASWLAIGFVGGCTGRVRGLLLVLGYALGQMLITIKPVLWLEFPLGWFFILYWMGAALVMALALVLAQLLVRHLWRRVRSKQEPVR